MVTNVWHCFSTNDTLILKVHFWNTTATLLQSVSLENVLFIDYIHIADKAVCSGRNVNHQGNHPTLAGCANACKGKSDIFNYGINENCLGLEHDGCRCFCEEGTTGGYCTSMKENNDDYIKNNDYIMYAFTGKPLQSTFIDFHFT